MRLLLCVDGYGTAEIVDRLGALVDLSRAEIIGLHVIDSRPRHEVEFARHGFIGAQRLAAHQARDIAAAERAHAEAVLGELAATLGRHGLSGEIISTDGTAEQRIVSLARERSADLLVLFPHRYGKATAPGPRSMGHTARFVVDHTPCAVLLLR